VARPLRSQGSSAEGRRMDAGLIDPDITIEDLVRRLPQASAVLRRFGIVCVQCGEPVWGTLREVAAEKGIHDLTEVLAALAASG
jgi:iron-sulfur cluster repair protein YtfE (RIC family)